MSPPADHAAILRTLGIDEAGRGPILGPLVLGAVLLDETGCRILQKHGVTDSKRFQGASAHARRSALVPVIRQAAIHCEVAVVDVRVVDRYCDEGGLNRLEREIAERLIVRAPGADRIVCDGARLFGPLASRYPQLEAHDKAESLHVAVAAASILAKVRRDELWHVIAARYAAEFGEETSAGGGYLNPRTRAFLRAYVDRHGRPPPEGRLSWPWTFVADLLEPS